MSCNQQWVVWYMEYKRVDKIQKYFLAVPKTSFLWRRNSSNKPTTFSLGYPSVSLSGVWFIFKSLTFPASSQMHLQSRYSMNCSPPSSLYGSAFSFYPQWSSNNLPSFFNLPSAMSGFFLSLLGWKRSQNNVEYKVFVIYMELIEVSFSGTEIPKQSSK